MKKFDNFDVNTRLERYDADDDIKSCGYERAINLYDTGAEQCYEVVSCSTASGGGASTDRSPTTTTPMARAV